MLYCLPNSILFDFSIYGMFQLLVALVMVYQGHICLIMQRVYGLLTHGVSNSHHFSININNCMIRFVNFAFMLVDTTQLDLEEINLFLLSTQP